MCKWKFRSSQKGGYFGNYKPVGSGAEAYTLFSINNYIMSFPLLEMVWDTWIDDILKMIILFSAGNYYRTLDIVLSKFHKCPTSIAICSEVMFELLIDLALVLEAS